MIAISQTRATAAQHKTPSSSVTQLLQMQLGQNGMFWRTHSKWRASGGEPPHNKTTVFESPVYTVVPCLIDGSEWKRHERKHKYKRKRRAEWRIDRERGGKPELLFYVSSLVIWTHATHYGASPTADFPPRKKKKKTAGDLRPFRQARWAPSWMFLRGQRGRVQTDQRVYEKTLMNSLSYGKEPKGMRLFCSLADCWWLRKRR